MAENITKAWDLWKYRKSKSYPSAHNTIKTCLLHMADSLCPNKNKTPINTLRKVHVDGKSVATRFLKESIAILSRKGRMMMNSCLFNER